MPCHAMPCDTMHRLMAEQKREREAKQLASQRRFKEEETARRALKRETKQVCTRARERACVCVYVFVCASSFSTLSH